MKNLRQIFVAFCVAILVGLVFLPLQNRQLFLEHLGNIGSRDRYMVFWQPVTSASPPIIQIYKAKDDSSRVLINKGQRDEMLISASMRKVVNKYPDDAAALAYYLRTDSRFINGLRVGGPLSTSDRAWSVVVNPSFPVPTFKPNGPFGSSHEYEEMLALIARGQKLEPQNTYFDWMMILALLHGGRQREAIQVVEKAWNKSDFDDHTGDDIVANGIYNRHNGMEPEMKLLNYSSTLLPHLGAIREITRYLAQHTMSLRMQGRDLDALEWGRKCLSFIRPMREHGSYMTISFAAAANERIILSKARIIPVKKRNNVQLTSLWSSEPPLSSVQLEGFADTLPHLAKQLNQPRILKEIRSEGKLLDKWKFKPSHPMGYSLDGVVGPELYWKLGWSQRLSRYLVMSLPATLLIWLLFSVVAHSNPLFKVSSGHRTIHYWMIGGVVGVLLICTILTREMSLLFDAIVPLNEPPGTCLDGTIHPIEILFRSTVSTVNDYNWWLGVGAVPFVLIWSVLLFTGAKEIDFLSPKPIGYRFPKIAALIQRPVDYFRFMLCPVAALVGLLFGISLIPIENYDEATMSNRWLSFVLLVLLLLVVPAVIMVSRGFISGEPKQTLRQSIPLFIWRVRGLLGGFIVASLLALAYVLPLQADLTSKFNKQFSIIEQRQTVQYLQAQGIFPRS